MNLADQLTRFAEQRNGCELLVEQSKLVERFFNDAEMDDLDMLMKFFRFLQSSMTRARQTAARLVLRLPGSKLLKLAYEHLKTSAPTDDEEKKLFEKFVVCLANVLKSLLELHPHCFSQLDSLGILDRIEMCGSKSSVCSFSRLVKR